MLTFKDIQDEVLLFLDQVDETGIGLDLVKSAIVRANERRLVSERWSFMLWPTPVNLSFVSGQRVYTLHPLAAMVSDFTNGTTVMKETPTRARYKSGVQEDRYHFEFVKASPVRVQPTEGVLTVTGYARIVYVDDDGDVQSEDVQNTTTTGTVTEVVQVTKLNASTLSIVDAASTTILSLTASEYGKTYPQIRLFADGNSADAGTYRFYKRPEKLDHDNDIPEIPYPFSRVLTFDALLEIATYNDSKPQDYWIAQADLWDRQLRQTYIEGESEGSESKQVQNVVTYEG